MMLIQTPGSFVWSASLAARLGVEGWSSWGVFLVTGCLQGCLLVMGISFEVKARRNARSEVGFKTNRFRVLANIFKSARGVDRYMDSHRTHAETDDEGGANVENVSSERSPLIKKNGKPVRTPSRVSRGS